MPQTHPGYRPEFRHQTVELALVLQKFHATAAFSMALKRSGPPGLLPTSISCRSPG